MARVRTQFTWQQVTQKLLQAYGELRGLTRPVRERGAAVHTNAHTHVHINTRPATAARAALEALDLLDVPDMPDVRGPREAHPARLLRAAGGGWR